MSAIGAKVTNLDTFADLLSKLDGLEVEEEWITSDVRPGRGEEQWLNLILRKR